jgi:undecaprenyl-diphosphatase
VKIRDALLLGTVQGLTEFLPISSSAHLALLRRLTGHGHAPRAFDIALHLATGAALVPATHRDVLAPGLSLAADIVRRRGAIGAYRPESRAALLVALATVPSVLAGALFHGAFERWGRRPERIALALLGGSAWMALAEASVRRTCPPGASSLGARTALALGTAQAVALAPGISRSGATIATGVLLGLGRATATRVSFQLALPVTVAASVRMLPELGRLRREGVRPLLAASLAAFVSSLAGVALLRRVLARRGQVPFIVYRCLLALALVTLGRRGRR